MDASPATRQTLIVKLRDPTDAGAWREFVALYDPLVYRLARRKGLQDADARDLCQEVFRAVAGAIDRWDPDRGSFRGWLSRITRNLLVNFLTRPRHQRLGSGTTSVQELLESAVAPDPSATALFEAEYRMRLFRWAADEVEDEFAPTTWRAFWLTAVEGRPPAAVAAELGLSVGAVYIARSRVLARLKKRIERLDDDASDESGEDDHAKHTQSCDPTGCGCWRRTCSRPTRRPGWRSTSSTDAVSRALDRLVSEDHWLDAVRQYLSSYDTSDHEPRPAATLSARFPRPVRLARLARAARDVRGHRRAGARRDGRGAQGV